MIQIIHGSIFDSKCDLLIVPCNAYGGVTRSVHANLHERGLPTQVGRIPYGKVHFRESRYEFASTIGYAASVKGDVNASDAKAISRLAREITRYATANQIRVVNIPLLGAGAGGMTPVDSFEALQRVLSTEEDITFNVFCFTREAYRNLSATSVVAPAERPIAHPRGDMVKCCGWRHDQAATFLTPSAN